MLDRLTQIEADLKQAAERSDYEAVDRMALEFGDTARRLLSTLPPAEILTTAQRVLDTLEWTRMVVLTGRANTAQELRSIPFVNRYLASSRSNSLGVQMDA